MNMNKRKIILASTSPRRRALLTQTGLEFEAVAGGYVEDMTLPLQPEELAKHLSRGKAESVADLYPDAVIIAADTFIAFKGAVLGKPHTPEKAAEMLRALSGEVNTIFTGFTILDSLNKRCVSEVIEAKVYFKQLTEEGIAEYVATGEPLDKAGAYAIQGIGKKLIEKIEGDWEGAVGLPTQEIMKVLNTLHID